LHFSNMDDKNPPKPVLPSCPCHPPPLALAPAPIQTITMIPPTLTPIRTTTTISTAPNEMDLLTRDEQEMLRQYRAAQASPLATFATLSPLSTQVPISRPSAQGACTPTGVASPLARASTSLPMERLAQRRATKRRHSILESGTEDSGAEGTCGGAESMYGGAEPEPPVDLVLDTLTRMHRGFAEPDCIGVEDAARLFAERDAFTWQLLGVIGTMARQIKELQGGGDTQATSLVRSGTKKIKVERTALEQQLADLAKVRTKNYNRTIISHMEDRLEHTLSSSVCLTSSHRSKTRYRQQETSAKMRMVRTAARFLIYRTGLKDQGQERMRVGSR
jgi:hypothetical protein